MQKSEIYANMKQYTCHYTVGHKKRANNSWTVTPELLFLHFLCKWKQKIILYNLL